jgi:hypothetical protein
LIIDPGRGTYDKGGNSAFFRDSTNSHSTIEIDGKKQGTSTKSPTAVPRSIDAWATNGWFDFFEGDHFGYPGFDHFRDVFFSRASKFWIVSDAVTAPVGSHTYNQTWHLLPDAAVTLDASNNKASSHTANVANVQIVPADPATLTGALLDGYWSPRMFKEIPAKYVSYAKTASGNQTFDTVLFPTTAADTTRNVAVTRLPVLEGGNSVATTVATALTVELDRGHNGNVGSYYLSHEATPTKTRKFGVFDFNGKMAYVETTADAAAYTTAAVKDGSWLLDHGNVLLSSPKTIKDLGVLWGASGSYVHLSGSSLIPDTNSATAIAVFAPGVTTVVLNGTEVPFTRVNNFVYAARAVNGYSPTDDAYVRGGNNPAVPTNYAVDPGLQVKRDAAGDNERRAYLRFEFNGAGPITSAKLRLFVQDVGSDASRVIKVYGAADFAENTVTFATQPAIGALLGSWTIVPSNKGQWLELDVTSYIANAPTPAAAFQLVNKGTSTANNAVTFSSKDGPINRPILVIN